MFITLLLGYLSIPRKILTVSSNIDAICHKYLCNLFKEPIAPQIVTMVCYLRNGYIMLLYFELCGLLMDSQTSVTGL